MRRRLLNTYQFATHRDHGPFGQKDFYPERTAVTVHGQQYRDPGQIEPGGPLRIQARGGRGR
jgi:hypothetical protein